MKQKRVLLGLVVLVLCFVGLRTYLIIKPVDYPINHDPEWDQGRVIHILPTVNHERFLIKVSFADALKKAPQLLVDGETSVNGVMTDTEGRFWRFDVQGLQPDRQYELVLKDASGERLCDSWPLKTFPPPDAEPEHLRLLIYT